MIVRKEEVRREGRSMKLEIEVYDCLCSPSIFMINGIEARADDFVNKYDHAPEDAEGYGCGDMIADIRNPSDKILAKYKISIDEYNKIAEIVAEKLSFGCCGWCV